MNFEKEYQALKKKLDEAIKDNLRDIEDSHKELDVIIDVMNKYPDRFTKESGILFIVEDALEEARALVADGEKLIKASNLLK
jgi:hypothetical protein